MKTINLKTAVPGPKSQVLMARREAAVPRGPYHATPIFTARSEGAVIEDVDGNRYLDFAGGIGCLNVGHRREPVLTAVKNQLDQFLHTCVQVTPYEGYVRLAERRPLALWQHSGKIELIDRVGTVIPVARLDRFAKLPMVVGDGAAGHAAELLDMLASEPDLAVRVTGVAFRRRDVRAVDRRLPGYRELPALRRGQFAIGEHGFVPLDGAQFLPVH